MISRRFLMRWCLISVLMADSSSLAALMMMSLRSRLHLVVISFALSRSERKFVCSGWFSIFSGMVNVKRNRAERGRRSSSSINR